MGVDYSASAVIGVKVFESDCYETTRVKTFEHDYPPNYFHDPQSGKPLWREARVCSLEGSDDVVDIVEAAGFGVFYGGCSEGDLDPTGYE
jgi:hypothetical protein